MPYPRLFLPLGLALFAVGVIAGARPGLLADLDLRAHDGFARQTTPPPIDPRVAIVVVDEASLAAYGQWPWPRDVVGRLVSRLAEAGAAAIAFDILFSEPDRLGAAPANALGPTSTDEALAAAIAAAPVVAGFAVTFDRRPPGAPLSACALHPLEPVRRDATPAALRLFSGTGAVCSVAALARAAKASGAINASPDSDGVLRRLPVMVALEGRTYPSLALAAVHLAAPGTVVLESGRDGTGRLRLGRHSIAVDGAGQALLRFRGPARTYPHLSAADALAGRLTPGQLAGRVVFVGATALGVQDVAATALDPRFPGVELHATLADALLGGAGSAPAGGLVDLGLAYAGTVVSVVLLWGLGTVYGSSATLLLGSGLWFGARALYGATGLVVSPIGALLALALGAVTTVATQLAAERRRADLEHRRRDQAQQLIVQTLTTLTETRDVDTGRHARRTQEYVRLLATTLAKQPAFRPVLTAERIDLIATLAPLHDIGKVGISDAVLNKPGNLTADEYTEMKRHATLGHDSLLKAEHLAGVHDNEVLALAKEIVYTHHERWDGSGYPRGLRGTAIPLAGRLVAVVDTYDALVEARAYKAALPPDRAREIIAAGRGTHFDPDVVDAFLRCFEQLRTLQPSAMATPAQPA